MTEKFLSARFVSFVYKMTKLISTRAPEDVIKEVDKLAEKEKIGRTVLVRLILIKGLQQFKLEYALEQYKKRKATLWKASQIAGISLWEFIEKIKEEKISHYSLEDAKEDVKQVFCK